MLYQLTHDISIKVTPLYSLSMFMPSIINGMGFTALTAQAMSAPPYAFGKDIFHDKLGH